MHSHGCCAHRRRRIQENGRVRLAPGQCRPRHQRKEIVADVQNIDGRSDIRHRSGRTHHLRRALLRKSIQPRHHTRQWLQPLLAGQSTKVRLLLPRHLPDNLAPGHNAHQLRNQRGVAAPKACDEVCKRIRHAILLQRNLPGMKMRPLRIRNCPVHVPQHRPHRPLPAPLPVAVLPLPLHASIPQSMSHCVMPRFPRAVRVNNRAGHSPDPAAHLS